jgi:hypothetical protein
MAMSAAERQQRYRQRALKDVDGLLYTRLDVMLDAGTAARLDEMVKASGRTKRDLVAAAIAMYAGSADAPDNMGKAM